MTRLTLLLIAALALAAPTAASAKKAKAVKLSGGATTLALSQVAADALAANGISLEVLKPARAGSAGVAFPVTTGKVDGKTLAGKIRHSGGLALSKGDTRLELRNFVIEIDNSPTLSAQVGDSRVDIVSLDLSEIEVSKTRKRVTVANVGANLTQGAADALNATFGTDDFAAGVPLGTATVKAHIKRHHKK
jgi:hypothetical protein